MTEKTIALAYDSGTKETLKILCSFDYDGRHYFIAKDPAGSGTVCRQMKWSVFKGTNQLSKPLPEKVLKIADTLLRKSDEDPEHYKLQGEHYKIRRIEKNGKRRLKYEYDRACSDCFASFKMNVSTSVCFAAAVLIGAVYAFVYTGSSGMMWATTVFPHMCRMPLKIMLYLFELIGTAVLFRIRDEDREWWDLFFNAMLPLNLITVIGMAKANMPARIILICLTALFCLFKVVPLVRFLLSKRPKKVKKEKAHRALGKMYNPILICVVCCLYAIRIFGIHGYTAVAATKTPYRDSETIMTYYEEALESINENVWKDLSVQQRLDTLQSICNFECVKVFGCSPATVQTGYPQSEYTLGEYNSVTNTILINVEHMTEDPVHEVVNTLLHETRHLYQHALVDMLNNVEGKLDEKDLCLPVFQYAVAMRENFDNYKNPARNYEEYCRQSVEADSRSWADSQTVDRYDRYIYADSITQTDAEND